MVQGHPLADTLSRLFHMVHTQIDQQMVSAANIRILAYYYFIWDSNDVVLADGTGLKNLFSKLQIGTRTTVRVTNMDENAHCKNPIFQEMISRVLFEIETRGRVFCIALGPVTSSIAIRTIGLLYLFYNTG